MGLKELQDADIVILWRSFHETNGGWFRWGAKDPAVFIRVWRHLFDYFTKTKGLNNLVWVYGPKQGLSEPVSGLAYASVREKNGWRCFDDDATCTSTSCRVA